MGFEIRVPHCAFGDRKQVGKHPGLRRRIGGRGFDLDVEPIGCVGPLRRRFMLERYAREAAQGGFAIYMGDEEQGTVRPLA